MTEHKHLKALVRERIGRTGESYSTARRQVLAAVGRDSAPTLPPGLVPGYGAFGGGQHQRSTLLAHLLRQAGYVAPHTGRPYGEALLCGLGGGIGFMYAVFEYRGVPPILTVVAQHHPQPWVPAALDRLGIGYTSDHSGSAKPALAALDHALDGGRAVFCTVARNGLPWRATPGALATEPHGVVVAGRHDGRYWLDDEAVSPRVVSPAELAAAWSGYKKGRHERLLLTPAEPTGGPDAAGLANAVRAAIATTVAHLTGPVLGNSFDTNFGFSGMARLAEQLRDERGKLGWTRRFGAPGHLPAGLRRLYECLELENTAPAATRPLYADFLDEAAGVLGDPRLPEAAALFRRSGEVWSRLVARVVAVLDDVGPYAELVERRMFLLLCGGTADDPTVAELTGQIEQVGAGRPELSPDQRATLFGELADLVESARTTEQSAVALLE